MLKPISGSWIAAFLVSISLGAAPVWAAKKTAAAGDKGDAKAAPSNRYENLELFQKVLQFVEANYVDEVKHEDLIHGAVKGMLETLDPHSNFLTPEVFRDMKIDTAGKFGGLGIELGMKDNVLTIIAPIEDTPAWRAGLKPNDRIVKIEGESTKGMTLTEAISKMRGDNGKPAHLTIYREGFDAPKDFALNRETIKIQSVKYETLEPGFGYVRLTNFNETAASDIEKAIAKIESGGKKNKLQGLVLDLRNNPGGLLEQSVDVSSLFLDEGVIVSTIGRNKDQKEVKYARKGHVRKDFPLAILVNSSTASAAEIVSGALQDHHRAIIMGQPTFGKGSVQTVVELGQDMGLKLTIARYFTPSGRSIQEKGVIPDIVLDDFDPKVLAEARRKSDSIRERDLKGHIVNPDASDLRDTKNKQEFQLDELKVLSKKGDADPKKANADDTTPQRFLPKEDYQVREALNHLKSFEIYRGLVNSGSLETGASRASSETTTTDAPASK